MGDITAQRLRYHPMVRFFGKPSISSLGDNVFITTFMNWQMRHSISDMYHANQPEVYLNRSEFPIDEPVWFTPDGVARGQDTVVNRANAWITTMPYAHDIRVSKATLVTRGDSIGITAKVENPGSHELVVSATISQVSGEEVTSKVLLNDGLHGDGAAGDSIWGAFVKPSGGDGTYTISVQTADKTTGGSRTLPDVAVFKVVTGLPDRAGSPPEQFALRPNYPNPFNPGTTIRFELPRSSYVNLTVYDLLGRAVSVLVNEKKNAGFYETKFDGSHLASGVYIYRLQAGSFILSRKMVIVR